MRRSRELAPETALRGAGALAGAGEPAAAALPTVPPRDEEAEEDMETSESGQKERVALDQALAQHGVKAIVTSDRCAAAIGKGWRPLGKMQYCVLLIGGPGSS